MEHIFRMEKGSLTLEATIIFPVFLAFMLIFVNLINVCMVYIAMDHATCETVRQIAAHAYPLKYAILEGANNKTDLFSQLVVDSAVVNTELVVIDKPPSVDAETSKQMLSTIMSDTAIKLGKKLVGKVSDPAIRGTVKQIAQEKIMDIYPLGGLNEEDFKITQCIMYNPNNPVDKTFMGIPLSSEDIALKVDYTIKLPIPFFNNEITLSNTAVERAWAD